MTDLSSPHMQQSLPFSPTSSPALTTVELGERGNAMWKEGMCEQNAPSMLPINVVQEAPLLLPRNNFEDLPMEKQLVVTDGSLTAMDHVDSGSQFNTVEPPDIAPTVGAFTVQCAQCMKWRFIPTKEQYEVIRQSILEKPFFCNSAASWRPHASCSDPLEISPDLHELWAIDRPSIPLPPNGWERLLVIRPAGSIKFADIYYVTPSGRRLRSLPEIERFLTEYPEYTNAGVKSSQFSFLIPRPLDKDYCRKKNERLTGDEKGTVSKRKSYPKNLLEDSYLSKSGIVQNSLKVISSKPKLEKLKCRKKALTGIIPGGESGMFQAEERSFDSFAFKHVMRSFSPSEELESKSVGNYANATSG